MTVYHAMMPCLLRKQEAAGLYFARGHSLPTISLDPTMRSPKHILILMSLSFLLIVAALAVLSTNARFMLHLPGFWPGQSALPNDLQLVSQDGDVKVPVTLGVMSKCPDALLCESVFDKVIPQVENKIDLSLTFIGRY